MHELLHAAAFSHTHQRYDRNRFVKLKQELNNNYDFKVGGYFALGAYDT